MQTSFWLIIFLKNTYVSNENADALNVNSESFSSIALQFDAYQIINVFCFFLIAGYQNALNRGDFVRHLLATFSDL